MTNSAPNVTFYDLYPSEWGRTTRQAVEFAERSAAVYGGLGHVVYPDSVEAVLHQPAARTEAIRPLSSVIAQNTMDAAGVTVELQA